MGTIKSKLIHPRNCSWTEEELEALIDKPVKDSLRVKIGKIIGVDHLEGEKYCTITIKTYGKRYLNIKEIKEIKEK